ncbi:MAG TPA: NAD(P)H-dependent glycerol-3-phosphate dehydrogenase [Candidatus Kapabacteria bacterium]|nr:NAD(P)H-dependent glycerol-3-phosphate dehydrogenase [Candidatus Kapabacteria bacterium]
MRAAVIGAGGWGTTLAHLLAERGHDVVLWARSEERALELERDRCNKIYLPLLEIHPSLRVTHDASQLDDRHLFIFAVPAQATRTVVEYLKPSLSRAVGDDGVFVSASKGIERHSMARMSEVLRDGLDAREERILALSGPSHAEEVAKGIPTAVVAAGMDHALAKEIQSAFLLPSFRVYSSSDLIGVELAGALKNVIAICAGIIDGLGYGDNTKAALITRGLAEMRRLGIALGADEHTFSGLAGLGDLVVTCESRHSRNRFVGEEIGKGKKLSQVLTEMKMIAEGVATTQSAKALAERHHIEMPIVEETYRILFEDKDPREATMDLMTRDPKTERW